MTLTDFLLARIAEDEAAARAADAAAWVNGLTWQIARVRRAGAEAQHIARHDPDRVLAECEAKRRIVELHRDDEESHCCTDEDDPGLGEKMHWGDPCMTLRFAALPYADHPDHRPEWAVTHAHP